METQQKKSSKVKYLLIIVGVIIMGNVVLFNMSEPTSNTQYVSQADPVEWAGTYAVVYVTKALKAPSTAKFPVIGSSHVTALGNSRYRVSSHVDSQNGFGAMVRSNWIVLLTHNGGDADLAESWKLEQIAIDGEVVYDDLE
jgi:hypothetical protein